MTSEEDSKRNCFTFIWKLENANYCWQSCGECIESPVFTVDEIHGTNWKLVIYPSVERNHIRFYLERQADNNNLEIVKIDCDLAFLSSDGKILGHAFEKKNENFWKKKWVGDSYFASPSEVFSARRSEFLPQDTLTARCRMWKSVGEMSKDIQCFGRTRINVEKRSFLWSIANFSFLKSHEKRTFEIKSNDKSKNFMDLELCLAGGLYCDETVRVKIIPNYENIRTSSFKLSIVDASKNTLKCFRNELWYRDPCGSKDFTLFSTKSELLEKKSAYLPDDVLSLSCECTFSFGTLQAKIEKVDSDCIAIAKTRAENRSLDTENQFSDPKYVLLDNLRSMLNNSCLSDVNLRTKTHTYPSHSFILGARSPVFKSMFSNDMKEKINKCVDIEDLNDDTVLRMLRYIYSVEVDELDWVSAIELYEASDKYQILSLKDICSSYIKNNLCINNTCEALVLADMHLDKDLKVFVQDFILRHGKDIINSDEWDQLMETNLKLAAETMRRKFKD